MKKQHSPVGGTPLFFPQSQSEGGTFGYDYRCLYVTVLEMLGCIEYDMNGYFVRKDNKSLIFPPPTHAFQLYNSTRDVYRVLDNPDPGVLHMLVTVMEKIAYIADPVNNTRRNVREL